MAGEHEHAHGMVGAKLRAAFLLTLLILLVELGGGLLANSLALLADAGHVLTDVVALGLAWLALRQAERPADGRNTYGYHRTGILVALMNAATLLAIVIWVGVEAIQRFLQPPAVTPAPMFAAAAVGIVVNLFIGFSLRGEEKTNLNVRAAMLHVFGDVGASAAVVVAGLVILLTRWYPADPLLSLAIAVLIARGAYDVLRETLGILMEATPTHVNVAELVRDVMRLRDVTDVHDLHVWSLAGGMAVLTAHVRVGEDCSLSRCDAILAQLKDLLEHKYAIAHTTIQFECEGCTADDLHCSMGYAHLANDHAGHDHLGHDHAPRAG
jgi:cobalt-zinc-cadmium efflux system protein